VAAERTAGLNIQQMWSHLLKCGLSRPEAGTQDEVGNTMSERRIGIRELKSKLSECVREVRQGQTIVVTERGRAVARLIPDTTTVRDRLTALKDAGGIQWSGRRLGRTKPVARARGKRTVADMVSENRE